jgi:hypothetical protein
MQAVKRLSLPRQRRLLLALGVLVHLAACRGSDAGGLGRGAAGSPEEERARRVALFRQQLLALSGLPALEVSSARTILGTQIIAQSPHSNTPGGDLAPTDLMMKGRAFNNEVDSFVSITPSPSLHLTFRDLEDVLLDLPYTRETPTAHFIDELPPEAVGRVDHLFGVKAGSLAVLTHPRVDRGADPMDSARALAEGPGGDSLVLIDGIIIDKRARGTKGQPTLRQIRARKAASSADHP